MLKKRLKGVDTGLGGLIDGELSIIFEGQQIAFVKSGQWVIKDGSRRTERLAREILLDWWDKRRVGDV